MTVAPLLPLVAVVGLAVGSFLNVVVHRVPAGLSVVRPPSACPGCGHQVRARDNVPVVSWLVLRGRCRDCQAPIPVRYPLVEAGTAVAFLVVALRLGASPLLPALLGVVAAGVALALIDLEHGRLPFGVTGAAAACLGAGLAVAWAVGAGPEPMAVALGATAWLAVYGGAWLVTRGRGMGLGDVALAPVLGAALGALGAGPALVGLLAGFVLGAVAGVALVLGGSAGRRTAVPFGPFMLAGAALALLGGTQVAKAYLALAGLA